METILQIKVDENVLNDAEITASYTGYTVAELASDFVLNLAKQKDSSKRPMQINSKEELITAIKEGLDDFENDRVISEEVMMDKLKRYARM